MNAAYAEGGRWFDATEALARDATSALPVDVVASISSAARQSAVIARIILRPAAANVQSHRSGQAPDASPYA